MCLQSYLNNINYIVNKNVEALIQPNYGYFSNFLCSRNTGFFCFHSNLIFLTDGFGMMNLYGNSIVNVGNSKVNGYAEIESDSFHSVSMEKCSCTNFSCVNASIMN